MTTGTPPERYKHDELLVCVCLACWRKYESFYPGSLCDECREWAYNAWVNGEEDDD